MAATGNCSGVSLNNNAHGSATPTALALVCVAAATAPIFTTPPLLPALAADATAGSTTTLFIDMEEAISREGYKWVYVENINDGDNPPTPFSPESSPPPHASGQPHATKEISTVDVVVG